ncbi:MAG TPA: hypothetical protein VJZ25_04530, partial [Gemmatimonadaceae bacterium]|nr:hypothetical protein [Gemmatimonadaceae bacterium]
MRDWAARVDSLLGELGKNINIATRMARSILDEDPLEILAYRGYGDGSRAHVYGRVLEERGVSASTDSDSTFRNLLNTLRRAESDPLPFALVKVEYAATASEMNADDEGFFGGWISTGAPIVTDAEWHRYEVSLVGPPPLAATPVRGSGEILVP